MKKILLLLTLLLSVFSMGTFAQEDTYPEDEMLEYEENTTEYIAPEEAEENFELQEDVPREDEWSYNTEEPLPEDY